MAEKKWVPILVKFGAATILFQHGLEKMEGIGTNIRWLL